MRALLDINVLIALLDPQHIHHSRAHGWFAVARTSGWASCPLTENGCVRVLANPAYSRTARFPAALVVDLLRRFAAGTEHEFWPDDVSLLDRALFDPTRIHGHQQLTDLYLLALVVARRGRLATFDETIPISAIAGAKKSHVAIL
jgi:toxin-antitoxin system PIN domain toxin